MTKSDKMFMKATAERRATGRALRYATRSGFANATDVLEAISGNVGTTLKGFRGSLSGDQARILGQLRRTSERTSDQQARTTARTGHQIANRYGSAVAGAVAPQMENVRAVQRASKVTTRANTKAGGLEAKGGQQAMGLIQAGTREANAAANAQLAEAYKYRVQDDARFIAEQRMQLQQMKLQAQLEFETWKKQQDYLQKLETGSQGGVAGIAATAQSAASSFSGLQSIFNTKQDTNGDGEPDAYPNGVQAAQAYIAENGITDPNEQQLVLALSSAMYRAGAGPVAEGQLYGPGTSDETRQKLIEEALKQQLVRLYPQFAKHSDRIMEAVSSGISAQRTINSYEALARTLQTESRAGSPAASLGEAWAKQLDVKSLEELARRFGIDPRGLTRAQLEAAVEQAVPSVAETASPRRPVR